MTVPANGLTGFGVAQQGGMDFNTLNTLQSLGRLENNLVGTLGLLEFLPSATAGINPLNPQGNAMFSGLLGGGFGGGFGTGFNTGFGGNPFFGGGGGVPFLQTAQLAGVDPRFLFSPAAASYLIDELFRAAGQPVPFINTNPNFSVYPPWLGGQPFFYQGFYLA